MDSQTIIKGSIGQKVNLPDTIFPFGYPSAGIMLFALFSEEGGVLASAAKSGGDGLVKQAKRANAVHQSLLDFYGYPQWRNPLPALDELVSTILSQNTNDLNRDAAFEALKARFSSWEAVRDADVEDVIATIRPAGLANQKGPRIQAVLRDITAERGELSIDFLSEYSQEEAKEWLMKFKGVGPKTAAIVLQFSLGMAAFPVDTHIYRVTGRIGLRPPKMSADQAHEYFEDLLPADAFYPAHLNIIRLGREICQARRPKCPECPLQGFCDYYAENYDSEGDLLDAS